MTNVTHNGHKVEVLEYTKLGGRRAANVRRESGVVHAAFLDELIVELKAK